MGLNQRTHSEVIISWRFVQNVLLAVRSLEEFELKSVVRI